MKRMRRMGPAALLLAISPVLLAACSSTTRITTYPSSYEVFIDGKSYGKSPAQVTLPNRTFGDYVLMIKTEEGAQLYQDRLELEVVAWGIFWPPFGIFYNLYGVARAYEIDVVSTKEKPSEERRKPLRVSRIQAANILTDMGFQFLDRGMLLEARYYLEVSLQIDPLYPDAIQGLAIYHRQKGEDQKAQKFLDRYNEAAKNFVP